MSALLSGKMGTLAAFLCRRPTTVISLRQFSNSCWRPAARQPTDTSNHQLVSGSPELGRGQDPPPSSSRRRFRPDSRRGTGHGERSGKYVMLVIPLVTFGLGTWQVYRRRRKLDLIAALRERTSAEPIDLPHDLEELNDLEYRKVRVTGTFDHSREVYVRPRSLFVDGREQDSGGIISSGQSNGLHVITAFKLSDRGPTILINRGWVSRHQANPSSRANGQVEGEVELVGVVRRSESRAPFVPKKQQDSPFFHYRDTEKMALMCDAVPVFLDADADSTVPGGPRGGQTKVSLRNDHMSYIITWYSLSATTLFLWFRRYVKKRSLL